MSSTPDVPTTPSVSEARAAERKTRNSLYRSTYPIVMLVALVILVGVTYLSLITGRYPLELDELFRILGKNWFGMDLKVYKPAENMLLTVRIPRLLAAGLIGAALAIAGATFQAVFRNPLVSPYLLGVSQGASVGAATAILLGVGTTIAIQGSALAGGLIAVLLTVTIPRLLRNESTLMLVLSGVIVGGFGTAALGGSDTTKLMPLSILMGASFMMFVDTLARSLTSAEVPLSVLTGFIGTPLYVALLLLGKVRVK